MVLSEIETCLCEGVRARKDHPRIVFRGALDALLAHTLCCAQALGREGLKEQGGRIGALIDVIRALMAAEYSGEPFSPPKPVNAAWEAAHAASHDPVAHFGVPRPRLHAGVAAGVAALNLLRTQVRACERMAVAAFDDARLDIVHALNRLSSYVYALMCEVCAAGGGG